MRYSLCPTPPPPAGEAGLAFVRRPSVGPTLRFGASPTEPRGFATHKFCVFENGPTCRLPTKHRRFKWQEHHGTQNFGS